MAEGPAHIRWDKRRRSVRVEVTPSCEQLACPSSRHIHRFYCSFAASAVGAGALRDSRLGLCHNCLGVTRRVGAVGAGGNGRQSRRCCEHRWRLLALPQPGDGLRQVVDVPYLLVRGACHACSWAHSSSAPIVSTTANSQQTQLCLCTVHARGQSGQPLAARFSSLHTALGPIAHSARPAAHTHLCGPPARYTAPCDAQW